MNPKHRRFVTEYLKDRNATQAARRAGYSRKTARQQGARLLSKAAITATIGRMDAKALEKAQVTLEWWIEENRRVAASNLQDFYDEQGELIPIHLLPREVSAALSGHEVVMKNAEAGDGKIDRVLKLRLWDKLKALEMVGKHFKWLDRLGESDAGDWEKLAARLASIRTEGSPPPEA